MALLFAVAVVACHKEEQAVVGVAQNAVSAEHQAQAKAQAAATEIERLRAQMERIPLPTKGMYTNVHETSAWSNPFLNVDAESITLRFATPDANPSANLQGAALHSDSAHHQEIHLRPEDLAQALVGLPPSAWRYGRVIAVAESPQAKSTDRPKVRRNVEAAIQKLNDLGIVVDEWPVR